MAARLLLRQSPHPATPPDAPQLGPHLPVARSGHRRRPHARALPSWQTPPTPKPTVSFLRSPLPLSNAPFIGSASRSLRATTRRRKSLRTTFPNVHKRETRAQRTSRGSRNLRSGVVVLRTFSCDQVVDQL